MAADHEADQVRREDLPAPGRRAQPGRLDDRVAEVVGVVLHRLAGAQADPDREVLAPGTVVVLDRLLHAHRAGQRPAQRGVHDHQPVAEILDLGAA